MPKGGARKGAGRKPKPLSQKIAEGNRGKRPLKKVEFENTSYDPATPPVYLPLLEKKHGDTVTTPMEIYRETIAYLEPSGCLHLIPKALLRDYVMANYHMTQAHYELSQSSNVGKNDKGEVVITSFADIMLKYQKNVLATWDKIWEIVSRNSEHIMDSPEHELMAVIFGGRVRRIGGKGAGAGGAHGHP